MCVNKNVIPLGNTHEEIKQRSDIIWQFYQDWKARNRTQRVFNNALRDYINVRQISIEETARHASKRYLSTLAVLQLDAILSCAKLLKKGRLRGGAINNDSRQCL